jgi:hypothetical protein
MATHADRPARRDRHELVATILLVVTAVAGCALFAATVGWTASFPVSIGI